MVVFDCESDCVQEDKFRDKITATWIRKHFPVFISLSSNLIEELIFLGHSNPGALVESFVVALDGFATQSKSQTKLEFLEVETTVKSKLNQLFFAFRQRHCHKKPVIAIEHRCAEEEEEQDVSTHFLQRQENEPTVLLDHLKRSDNILLVFGFNSAKYGIDSLEIFLLTLLANKRRIEPIRIKRVKKFVSFEFGDVQLLDILNFLGGATSLDFLENSQDFRNENFFAV